MECTNCGALIPAGVESCLACGAALGQAASDTQSTGIQRGFSARINDPAFTDYIRKTNLWSIIVTVVLAVASLVGFYIAGENSREFTNPGAFILGIALAVMFLLIGLFSVLSRKLSKTWDGVVEDKRVKKKTERQDTGDDTTYHDYLEYSLIIRSDDGKKRVIKFRNNEALFNYYPTGSRVRHHAGLKTLEKFDKSGDKTIPCNYCSTMNDIKDDVCVRCKCPLLK